MGKAGGGSQGEEGKLAAAIDSALELSRLDVIRWMADILAFRETALRRKKEHDDALRIKKGERPTSLTEPESDNVSRSAAGPPELAPFTRISDGFAPPDSGVVARFKQRLGEAVKKDPPITTTNGATRRLRNSSAPPQNDDTALPLPALADAGLYSDEDLETTYLRSTPERVVVEAVLRENGSWELHERRKREREEREKMQREREEVKRSKVLRGPGLIGTAGGEKRKRREVVLGLGAGGSKRPKAAREAKEARIANVPSNGRERLAPPDPASSVMVEGPEEDEGDEASEVEDGGDDTPSHFDPAWMKPVDFNTQTEGWSDGSAEESGDEHPGGAEQDGLDDDDEEDEGEGDDDLIMYLPFDPALHRV